MSSYLRSQSTLHQRIVPSCSCSPLTLQWRCSQRSSPVRTRQQRRLVHSGPVGILRRQQSGGWEIPPVQLPAEKIQGGGEHVHAEETPRLSSSDEAGPLEPATTQDPSRSVLDWKSWNPRVKGLLLLNLLVVLCATNWVVVKDVEAVFDPFGFTLARFAVAALAFSPFMSACNLDIFTGGTELGLWMGLGYLTQAEGLLTVDASRASFISTFTVIVVPMLAGLTGKGIKPLTWASAAAALVGVGLLEHGGASFCRGDVWSFLSAVFFGVQVFRTEKISRGLPDKALPLMSIVLSTVTGMAFLATLWTNPAATRHLMSHPLALEHVLTTGFPWGQILYTGLLTTAGVLLIELVALSSASLSSTDAAIVYTLEPVLGAALAFMVLGERWGPLGWVGAAIIVASSLGAQILGTTEDPQAQERD